MQCRLLITLIVILPIVGLMLCTSTALAVGIGVTPGKMDFSVHPGGSQVQTLYVINQDNQPSEFEVYVEGSNVNWVSITPAKFVLKSQESKKVVIAVAPPITAGPQAVNLSICVVSIPPDSDLLIGTGVKVSTHVHVTELPIMAIQWWIASAIGLVVVAIGIIVWWRQRTLHSKLSRFMIEGIM